jgi:hypothetical protein
MGFVYLIEDKVNNIYKIGTTKNLNKRIKSLQTGNPNELYIKFSFETKYPFRLESLLHRKFKQYHYLNEWYQLPTNIVEDIENIFTNTNDMIYIMESNTFFNKNLK